MPGVMTSAEVDAFDLDTIRTFYGYGVIVTFGDLIGWEGYPDSDEDESSDNEPVVKNAIKALVAAVGPDLAKRMVVDF
jgi:hypothetical protein